MASFFRAILCNAMTFDCFIISWRNWKIKKKSLKFNYKLKFFRKLFIFSFKKIVETSRKSFNFIHHSDAAYFFKGVAENFCLNLDIKKINNSRRKKTKKGKKKTRFKALFKFWSKFFLCCTMRVKWCWLNEWVLQFFLTFFKNTQPRRNLIVGEKNIFPLSLTNTN